MAGQSVLTALQAAGWQGGGAVAEIQFKALASSGTGAFPDVNSAQLALPKEAVTEAAEAGMSVLIVSQFGGDVKVSIPYIPREGEGLDAIVVYCVDSSGQLVPVSDCIYGPATWFRLCGMRGRSGS